MAEIADVGVISILMMMKSYADTLNYLFTFFNYSITNVVRYFLYAFLFSYQTYVCMWKYFSCFQWVKSLFLNQFYQEVI